MFLVVFGPIKPDSPLTRLAFLCPKSRLGALLGAAPTQGMLFTTERLTGQKPSGRREEQNGLGPGLRRGELARAAGRPSALPGEERQAPRGG